VNYKSIIFQVDEPTTYRRRDKRSDRAKASVPFNDEIVNLRGDLFLRTDERPSQANCDSERNLAELLGRRRGRRIEALTVQRFSPKVIEELRGRYVKHDDGRGVWEPEVEVVGLVSGY
jgi:hypothetical protein